MSVLRDLPGVALAALLVRALRDEGVPDGLADELTDRVTEVLAEAHPELLGAVEHTLARAAEQGGGVTSTLGRFRAVANDATQRSDDATKLAPRQQSALLETLAVLTDLLSGIPARPPLGRRERYSYTADETNMRDATPQDLGRWPAHA